MRRLCRDNQARIFSLWLLQSGKAAASPNKSTKDKACLRAPARRSSKCATRICKEQLDYWISPITGQRYPTRFKIEIHSFDAKFEVQCKPKEQEIVS